MEDEVAKHGKKIYNTIRSPKDSFAEKIKDIFVEIFIIVFAVTLSIWFHSRSEHSHEQKEVKEFLQGLSNDLTNDIKQLNTNQNVIAHLRSNYRKILLPEKGHESDVDSLIAHFEVDLRVTRPNIGRYEGFKSSGKIGTIENDSLKEMILVFYEQTIKELVYGENFVNDLQVKIQELSFENSDKISPKQFVAMPKVNSLMWLEVNNFKVNMREYVKAADHAQKIIEEIKNELD
jgi:flagellin-specific chaperone FliS